MVHFSHIAFAIFAAYIINTFALPPVILDQGSSAKGLESRAQSQSHDPFQLQLFNASSFPSTLKPFNATLFTNSPIECYGREDAPPINSLTCTPLMNVISRSPTFHRQTTWRPSVGPQGWGMDMCQVIIWSGETDSVFSWSDVLDVVKRILAVCVSDKLPGHTGYGGEGPVGKNGFVIAVVAEKSN